MTDPLIIVIAVVVILLVAGSLSKIASKVFRALSSLVGLVAIIWVVATIAGVDLPYLP